MRLTRKQNYCKLKKMIYDLEDRTVKFSAKIIEFCKSLGKDNISLVLLDQLVRAGTSIGANYAEANGASSRKDFKNKIYICKKEAQETRYWLRIIKQATPVGQELDKLIDESQQLVLIFGKIASKT